MSALGPPAAGVAISPRIAWPWLAIAAMAVSLAGLAAELGGRALRLPMDSGVVPYFSLSNEANVPTYFSAALLAGAAVLLLISFQVARASRAPRAYGWCVLAVGFAFMSIDEAIEIHEHLTFFRTRGVLYFSWVIPAAIIVLVVLGALVQFLRALAPGTRNRFLLAGALYVIGAVGFELPLGVITERWGNESLPYALVDWVEESLEIGALVLFVHALLRHLASVGAHLRFTSSEAKRHSDPYSTSREGV